jgi:hypothetical protein
MKRTNVLRGVLAGMSLLLAASCTSNQPTYDYIVTDNPAVITRPSVVTVTVRSDDRFRGSVSVTLNRISGSNPVKPSATLNAANQTVSLRTEALKTGPTWVTVTVDGVGAANITVEKPQINLKP